MDLTCILHGDFPSWQGLPPGVRLDDVLHALQPVEKVEPPYVAGRIRRERVTEARRAEPPSRVRIWCAWEGDAVTAIECEGALQEVNLAAILQALGAAEVIARDRRIVAGARFTEHVYASRGLTLEVTEPFDGRAPFLNGFTLYVPADAGTYLAEIGSGPTPAPEPIGG